ncbi:carboxylesterase 4A-like [Anticarsia gemmatalis]|uniref:carboxylesterase 4A-like n=1 Tax=Anticarsia gemmatalis TaxID=129554 RepID=UPI003F767903
MYQLLLCFIVPVRAELALVVLSEGVVIGQSQDGYNTFYGVPYAKVVNSNPFYGTKQFSDFKEPIIANDSSVMCPQVGDKVGGTLDCLRLNIYVPHMPQNETWKFPVLVWFHGVNLNFGSAGEYGGEHLVRQNIIVITVNYRLGVYGFLCTKSGAIPGNQGLKDQIEALRWIQKHIESFDGDPERVTIAGQGYGGSMVDLHLYSQYETLFQQAIIQSGSIFAKGFFGNKNHDAPMKLAKVLGQAIGKKTNPYDCIPKLTKTDPIRLINLTREMGYRMSVCKEDYITKDIKHFVQNNPFTLTKLGRIRNTTILIGHNNIEFLKAYANDTPEFYKALGNVFYTRMKKNFNLSKNDTELLASLTRQFYLGNKGIGPESKMELVNFASDFVVNHAVVRSIRRFLKAEARVFKYIFSYTEDKQRSRTLDLGAAYNEELKYLFEYDKPLVGAEQKEIRNKMVTMWANFVKSGNPSPSAERFIWEPVEEISGPYLDIDLTLEMRRHSKEYLQRMAFWDVFWFGNQKHSVLNVPKRGMARLDNITEVFERVASFKI